MSKENINIQEDFTCLEASNDQTGLAEIQKALAEIEKLDKESSEPHNGTYPDEVTTESSNGHSSLNGGEPEEEAPKKKTKRDWKETKKWYGAQAEIARLQQENERVAEANSQLQKHLNEALNLGTYHYGKSIYGELEAAKEAKDKAIDEGDKKALIDADIRINRIVNKIDELEKWGTTKNTSSTSPVADATPSYPSAEVYHAIAHDWLDTHPYLQPNSKEYDPDLATKVGAFVNQLDHTLVDQGRRDLFYSPQYFEAIDQQIEKLQNIQVPKGGEPHSYVGGVRNSYGAVNGRSINPNQVLLTADEKRMAYNAGISEEAWLKQKIIAATKR